MVIAIGRLTKPHGLRGEVVFLPYVYDMDVLPELTNRQVCLRRDNARDQERTITAWRYVNKRVLIRFEGIDDLDEAERLRDWEVCIARQSFPPLPPGEYYWFDIEGLTAVTSDGRLLGTITDIIHTGSNDVYVIRHETQEYLIPALKEVVRTIDLERGEMHLFPIPELLQ